MLGEKFAGLLAPATDLRERDLGVDAQAEQLFLIPKPELVAPPLAAAGLHFSQESPSSTSSNRSNWDVAGQTTGAGEGNRTPV